MFFMRCGMVVGWESYDGLDRSIFIDSIGGIGLRVGVVEGMGGSFFFCVRCLLVLVVWRVLGVEYVFEEVLFWFIGGMGFVSCFRFLDVD